MYRVIISFFLVLVIGTSSFPQTFGIGGGLTAIAGPDSYTAHDITGGGGFSGGYHLVAKVKINIDSFPLMPVASFAAHHFRGKMGGGKTSQSILSFGAGCEYKLKYRHISPYASLDLTYNNFGDLEHDISVEIGGIGAAGVDGSRFGASVGIGAEIFYHFDLSIKYNFLNLLGKEERLKPEPAEQTVSTLGFNLMLLIF